ncbi:Maestro heat-like repeat family member 5 [Sciurus carolinensis]|uniref:Maestro heat-like repeat family member 5 n=1 Tax=Sciurus carolinensis TaxID=30640 RepID=A0AA41N018_SCICA|nr:Maestro heat-like repeat family member 5 [Sciurus carolinensis]
MDSPLLLCCGELPGPDALGAGHSGSGPDSRPSPDQDERGQCQSEDPQEALTLTTGHLLVLTGQTAVALLAAQVRAPGRAPEVHEGPQGAPAPVHMQQPPQRQEANGAGVLEGREGRQGLTREDEAFLLMVALLPPAHSTPHMDMGLAARHSERCRARHPVGHRPGGPEALCTMLAPTNHNFHQPLWLSNRLSPREEQELELDFSDSGFLGDTEKCWSHNPHWEVHLVSKARAMLVTEQSLVLENIRIHLCDHSQLVVKHRVPDTGMDIQRLLELLKLDPQKAEDKAFLFQLYGIFLRECTDVDLVRRHLTCLLESSHQSCSQREGIALSVGLASTTHLEQVWALLEHMGRTRFLRWALPSPGSQLEDPDLHWKWVSSTSLLCYGQMATHAKERILPWVDNIISRMVYYFSCSHYVSPAGPPHEDKILESSFLSASILLTRVLRPKYGAQNYKFAQTPELIQCLLCILQKEPDFLVTLCRQKIILVIVGLSNLRPSLKPLVKSRILQTCLQSVYLLPPTEELKSKSPPMEPAPDVMALYGKTERALNLLLQNFFLENPSMDELCFLLQHMERWLRSDKSHERKRAVQSIFLLLQYVVDSLRLTEEATPSMLGHHIGLLTLLCRDRDKVTRSRSQQCVSLLLHLAVEQKGRALEFTPWNKARHFEVKASKEWGMRLCRMVKAFHRDLTVAQHTQLVLTLLHGLRSHSHLRCDLASRLLLMIFQDAGIKLEQVAEILHSLLQELPGIRFKSVQQTMMKATAVLGNQHTQEVVEVTLSLSHTLERKTLFLWQTLATNLRLARKVMTILYMKLKLRPPRELVQPTHQAQLVCLRALNTIYELLYTREYRATVRWAFAGLFMGLLTQLHYLLELGMEEGLSDYQEDILEDRPLGPCRTCLEALKGLFWTTDSWEVFAHVKLLDGWQHLECLDTYPEGVSLLARAVSHYDCEVKAILGQAIIFLKNNEERDNIVAILILTEFLNSPEVFQHVNRRNMVNFMNQNLKNPNQLVQAMSLQALSSILMHQKKVALLQSRLMELLDDFLQPEPKDPLGLMQILGDILHRLGDQSVGAASLKIAQHLPLFFEDVRAEVRGGAILLFGDVIHSGGKKFRQALKTSAFQALVPLLFHLADPCPAVVMKTKFTFLRCAILLKWEFQKELFSKLAWGRGLGAENDVFIYMVESNFGNYHQFLMQALTYLNSPHKNLKLAAMKFIGGMLQDYFTDLCFHLKKGDIRTLKKYLDTLRQDPDSTCRRFYLNFMGDIMELSQYVT